MAFGLQSSINALYSEPGMEALKKAVDVTSAHGIAVNNVISNNAGIPIHYFSNGPDGIFLMQEPENENYINLGLGNMRYKIPNLFLGGALGVYGKTKNGDRVIGIKPKFIEGPYNREKLAEYEQAADIARLLLKKTARGSEERAFLEDYTRTAANEISLMKNPRKTSRYILTHESTHRALDDIKASSKLSTEMEEGITENIAEDVVGYSLLGPKAYYTALKQWVKNIFGGKSGVYGKVRTMAMSPGY
ncbi:MAG: hypothetical protein NTU57_04010 [Candidatus Aenigmarchaeota archaeon]|nr:hypothetical protein [Candidatus Aenigmarchaeota archaeon]